MTMLDPLSGQLDHYMTLLSTRQKLVASNIANADTPNYKTQDIDFASELQQAQASQAGLTPVVSNTPGLRVKEDGNNVDLDREARLLAENALRFNVASNLLRGQIKSIRMAIQGGSGA
jgi:flagellar basal-body rod protein FlgB